MIIWRQAVFLNWILSVRSHRGMLSEFKVRHRLGIFWRGMEVPGCVLVGQAVKGLEVRRFWYSNRKGEKNLSLLQPIPQPVILFIPLGKLLDLGQANCSWGSSLTCWQFLQKKFYWNAAMPIGLWNICFWVGQTIWHGKLKMFTVWFFTEKNWSLI